MVQSRSHTGSTSFNLKYFYIIAEMLYWKRLLCLDFRRRLKLYLMTLIFFSSDELNSSKTKMDMVMMKCLKKCLVLM